MFPFNLKQIQNIFKSNLNEISRGRFKYKEESKEQLYAMDILLMILMGKEFLEHFTKAIFKNKSKRV